MAIQLMGAWLVVARTNGNSPTETQPLPIQVNISPGPYDCQADVAKQVFVLAGKGANQLKARLAAAQTSTNSITRQQQPASQVNTNRAIAVSPGSLNFGLVAVGTSEDLVVTVQNAGGSLLTGVAAVSAPFSIIEGEYYSLAAGQTQTLTVRYTPTAEGASSQVISFSGGGGATVSVAGAAFKVSQPPSVPLNEKIQTVLALGIIRGGCLPGALARHDL